MRTEHPKLGVFFKIVKIQLFDCFIAQLVKKLQQWSLYEVIEDILPFVLNTKRPLRDILLVSYKQNSFGCFRKNSECQFFKKHPKLYSFSWRWCLPGGDWGKWVGQLESWQTHLSSKTPSLKELWMTSPGLGKQGHNPVLPKYFPSPDQLLGER